MPALKNIRHEQFAQNVVSGLSLTAAYVSAGYKKAGASANAARLIRNETISSRVDELQNEIAAKLSQVRIIAQLERISSLQQRIEGYDERHQKLLQVIGERAVAGWDAPGASTGLLIRRERSIGSGANQKFVDEYEVDTGLLRELRELEKQAAIELGQWTEKRDVKSDINVNARAEVLAATFTLDELERMMNVAVKAAEEQQQQQQQGAVSSAVIPVSCEVVEKSRPKTTESAEVVDPDIREWMR